MEAPKSVKIQVLAVSQPSAYGQPFLPGTKMELDRIQSHTGAIPFTRVDGIGLTIQGVKDGLKEHSWVHFACHAIQDSSKPIESSLLLGQNSRLTLAEITKLSLPHAEFAFLSACQTATGDEALREEAVHLAAGMLFAGYRGVIATMWSILDSDAPLVADSVYAHLFKDANPDPAQAAKALHLAVHKLRNIQGKSFFSWVPFIHLGV